MGEYEYVLQGFYHPRTGWETLSAYPGTTQGKADAWEDFNAYRQAEPEFKHRVRRTRQTKLI